MVLPIIAAGFAIAALAMIAKGSQSIIAPIEETTLSKPEEHMLTAKQHLHTLKACLYGKNPGEGSKDHSTINKNLKVTPNNEYHAKSQLHRLHDSLDQLRNHNVDTSKLVSQVNEIKKHMQDSEHFKDNKSKQILNMR